MSITLASSVLLLTGLASVGQPLTVDGNGTVQIRAIDEAHLYFVGTERDSGREAVRAVNFQ